MELLDVYDINRIKQNKTMVRGEKCKDGEYRLSVHVCIFNSDNKILLQRRSFEKEDNPGKWDLSVGGSAISGDTSQMAAQREVLEEIGINIDFTNLRPIFTFNFPEGFNDFYIIEKDIDINDIKFNEEVMDVKWASKEEIMKYIDDDKFTFLSKGLIQYLFDLKDKKYS